MFSRSDLQALSEDELTSWAWSGGYPGLHYTVYPQFAFSPPDSEQHIRLTRAPRVHGDNGLRFWLSSEWGQDWTGREIYFSSYIHGAAFEQISEEEFLRWVREASAGLIVPLSLPLNPSGHFLGALLQHSRNADFTISILAEYDDELIHFWWDTTA
ncbi:MAG: hypothetical protein V4662_27420 [Verrucomicrobiota bacterium]